MTHVIVEAEHASDETMAGSVARALCEAYPGHPWHVNITGGMLVIKHMRLSNKWAMARKYNTVAHDFKRLKHEVVMAGGEFLERAGLTRGMDSGERIRSVDGIPKKDLSLG